MKLKIFITKNILEQSMHCSELVGQNCAIGKAVFALFGNKSWVGLNYIEIYSHPISSVFGLEREDLICQIHIPDVAIRFIELFDRLTPDDRLEMTPISFDINIPEEFINSLGIDYIHGIVETEPQLELIN